MHDIKHSSLDKSALHLLHRAGQIADELFAAEMAGSDLTPRQFAVLAALARHETASQTDIVRETGIDRSTLADIVKRLVARGSLVRRRARHDARAYAVRLTPAGQTALRQAEPAVHRVNERLLKALGARRSELVSGLSSIVGAFDGSDSHHPQRTKAA
jgi:DNA-binding MarR family transcriptional regulator